MGNVLSQINLNTRNFLAYDGLMVWRGGFKVEELFAASITTLDIIVVYALLQVREGRFVLALWTALLNMVLPFLGFLTGEFSAFFFAGWSTLLSGVLLGLIGLHMILQDDEVKSSTMKLHPAIIALAVSVDSFSVSVSFGMLHLNKILFILASGIFSLIFAYVALRFKGPFGMNGGRRLRQFAGLALLVMGVLSCIR